MVISLIGLGSSSSSSSLAALAGRVAMFAVVITVFMAASRRALAFIYDSQKGHKRERAQRERGGGREEG